MGETPMLNYMIHVAESLDVQPLRTSFASAERAAGDEVRRQHAMLEGLAFVRAFLDAMPSMSVVLNAQRQIVLSNKAFADYVGAGDVAAVPGAAPGDAFDTPLSSTIGRRPGEAAGCVHAGEEEGGCGTTSYCRQCGAVRAILNSQLHHVRDVQECRMMVRVADGSESALDFRAWAQPVDVAGETFTVFSLQDISNEKRRESLERIFFHDVMNTAGGLKGLADLMQHGRMPDSTLREVAAMVSDSSSHLIEEISAQRALSAAEHGDLQVSMREVQSLELLDRVIQQFHSFALGRGKEIRVHDATEQFTCVTDPVLLRRILVNLVKNALEAVPTGGVVTIGAWLDGDEVIFSVHNTNVIPPEVQLQVFQRSFSTKGSGRGLGTYSVKLLAERYLHGTVSFVSDEATGTTFRVRCQRVIAGELPTAT